MKKTLWQKVDRKIGRLKIFRNSAIFIKNTVEVMIRDGSSRVECEKFELPCPAPEKASAHIVDQTLVHNGDLTLTLDYLTLRKICDDNANRLTWTDRCAFFTPGSDEIQFAGTTYSIRSVIPKDWQNNMPGEYLIVLKGVGEDEVQAQ